MTVPRIGFGTAPVLGRIGKKQSLRALHHAHNLGVRHFDTARSYGWGEAERVLGEFLKGHPRDSYTIVSKCGIVPVRRSPYMAAAKAVARRVVSLWPQSRALVTRVASTAHFQPTRTYDVEALRTSLHASLRELRTSYLDVLLLHNFDPQVPGFEQVLGLFIDLRAAGLIRRFGFSVEGDLHQGLAFLDRHDALTGSVVQAPVSRQLFELPERWRSVSFVTHSPFRYLHGADPDGAPLDLQQLLISLSAACRCEALVTSMFSRKHIEQNVRAGDAAARFVRSAPDVSNGGGEEGALR
ncbi:MAG: putative oxidoreductase, aryl-alcohol dehydrogenase like protein [Myxococcaceae bacterium]|nr:putative oxidoreductase, aryl-alcohol dehydrogenase like protein [Myxococcaceae bacterium]